MESYSLDDIEAFECLQCEVRDKVMHFMEILHDNKPIQAQDLQQLCTELTDYLTSGVLLHNQTEYQDYPLDFSDKYANSPKVDTQTLKSDLAKLVVVLSNRWTMEEAIVKRLHSQLAETRHPETRPV